MTVETAVSKLAEGERVHRALPLNWWLVRKFGLSNFVQNINN